jgi:UDP-N-acetylglucosamine--N-acetylmuramyl-(pentapeptide) pyrophosphoryl-undecaprenol N-acetylglucosamine transferase
MTAASKTTGAILLAAGGTGGHMFPAEALARALIARGRRVILVTDRRGRGFGDRLPAVEVFRITAAGLAGGSLLRRAQGIAQLLRGYLQARRLVIRLRPALVVGFGGYASVPTVYAAQRAGLPTLLHEQNAVLGRANRMLAAHARAIATSFPDTAALGKATPRLTGNPVRPAIAALGEQAYPAMDGTLRLLVLGGSQGARVFARLIPAALAALAAERRRRIAIAQQCRPEDLDQVRSAYAALGQPAELADFFTDVAERLALAHLVISRSGASTVAELAAAGRPAILLPYPHATDDHQTANAAAFAGTGAGWLMPEADASPESLAQRLAMLLDDPTALTKAAAAARRFSQGDAAARLADLAEALIPGNGGHPQEAAA